jgi:hypothetical protein
MSNAAHWDCWGSHGEMQHVNKPIPDSTPEAAMDELLSKARAQRVDEQDDAGRSDDLRGGGDVHRTPEGAVRPSGPL